MTRSHLLVLLGTLSLPALTAEAGEAQSSIARGGMLYDKWFAVVNVEPPKGSHPAYPKKGAAFGKSATYRCKECHGWDYRGEDGAYAKGKHFTGIAGIRGSAGADPKAIVKILKDEDHGYQRWLKDRDLQDLARFVSKGQLDMDRVIDRKTKAVKGKAARGEAIYNTVCAKCHGLDGKGHSEMEDIGAVAKKNPWEALHKILNGQPDETMPALRAFDLQISLDVLAYTQTLAK